MTFKTESNENNNKAIKTVQLNVQPRNGRTDTQLILQTIWEQHITRVIVRTVLAIS